MTSFSYRYPGSFVSGAEWCYLNAPGYRQAQSLMPAHYTIYDRNELQVKVGDEWVWCRDVAPEMGGA